MKLRLTLIATIVLLAAIFSQSKVEKIDGVWISYLEGSACPSQALVVSADKAQVAILSFSNCEVKSDKRGFGIFNGDTLTLIGKDNSSAQNYYSLSFVANDALHLHGIGHNGNHLDATFVRAEPEANSQLAVYYTTQYTEAPKLADFHNWILNNPVNNFLLQVGM